MFYKLPIFIISGIKFRGTNEIFWMLVMTQSRVGWCAEGKCSFLFL